MFINRAINRFFARFHLRYEDAQEEQEFEMAKGPIMIGFYKVKTPLFIFFFLL